MARSLKGCYPFRLATTSFIHPAGYLENVRRLAPLLDEIELLFLERLHPPSTDEILQLRDFAEQGDITYNIHLPMDISVADPSPANRKRSIDAVVEFIERAIPLNPTSHTLHLTFPGGDQRPDTVRTWQETAVKGLTRLLDRISLSSRALCLETLDFPPLWLSPIVERLDLSICLDAGHLLRFGFGLEEALQLFSRRIGIFHLHGVSGTSDHLALNHLSANILELLAKTLRKFSGSVSLEVFSHAELTDSMACFSGMMSHVSTFATDRRIAHKPHESYQKSKG